MTPKQQKVIDFLCAEAEKTSLTCKVVHEPRDAREGAKIRVTGRSGSDEYGIASDGYPIGVTMSQYHDPALSTFFRRVIPKAKKLR